MTFRGVLLFSIAAFLSSRALGFQDGEPMRFETPKMNEEEQHSPHTPKSFEMTCDSCTAIAYQVIERESLRFIHMDKVVCRDNPVHVQSFNLFLRV